MTEELQKKAEDFIIDRYKIAECYREDNAETREYMRMDVHSQYEEEYKLYLDATKELEQKLETERNSRIALVNKIAELEKENADLKVKVGLSIDCEKAQKDGELCLGYGGYEEEPCERCKNCIKCECGYYQLGETEKDEQLIKAKEIICEYVRLANLEKEDTIAIWQLYHKAEQFLNSEVEK